MSDRFAYASSILAALIIYWLGGSALGALGALLRFWIAFAALAFLAGALIRPRHHVAALVLCALLAMTVEWLFELYFPGLIPPASELSTHDD